jgi:hypothetical protein
MGKEKQLITRENEPTIQELVARLAELERANARMNEELLTLRAAQPAVLAQTSLSERSMAESEQAPTERPKSRRRLLRTGLGVAVATVGAAALLEMNTGAAHADGNESPTIFTSNASGTPAVTANNDTGDALSANSILGNGVGAFSKNATAVDGTTTSGTGVFGSSVGGTGVFGLSKLGIGVIANSGFGTALQVQGHMQVQGDAVGQATLPKGKSSVTVSTNAATTTSNILLTLLSNPGQAQLWVTRAAGSFTIHASHKAASNISIAFLVIN